MFISNKKPKKRKYNNLFMRSQRTPTARLEEPTVPISERIKAYEAKTGNKLISE